MAVKIVCEPGKVITWEEFLKYPPYSIAVDGYCEGGPRFDEEKMVLNINHHEEVNRMATRSSCDQALVAVKMGLFRTFKTVRGKPNADIYVNDCDQDVIWATYILRYPQHADRTRLKRLVRTQDLMDMSSGFYPIDKRWHNIKQLAWITELYDQARQEGRLTDMSKTKMTELIQATHRRITSILFGKTREITLDTKYEVIQKSSCWSLVKEIGPHAKIGLMEDGIDAFVSLVGQTEDGRFRYSVGRRSEFIMFPIKDILDALNRAEGIDSGQPDHWGGGDIIGGSPRGGLSAMTPEEVFNVVEHVLKRVSRCVCPEHQKKDL